MKTILMVLCVAALATLASTSNNTWGRRTNLDKIIFRELVVRYPNKNYVNVNVVFPKSGQINNKTITAIFCTDNFRNASGANSFLASGGPGLRFATIALSGQFNRGINSTVEMYG